MPLRPLVDVSNLSQTQIRSLTEALVTAATAKGKPHLLGQIHFIAPSGQMTPGQWNALFAGIVGHSLLEAKILEKYLGFKQTVIIGK